RILTYRELDLRSADIAEGLRAKGVGPGARAGFCGYRSEQMMAGLLGILKAGAAYVPLDPDYPKDRLEFMIEDAAMSCVLDTSGVRALPNRGQASQRELLPAD